MTSADHEPLRAAYEAISGLINLLDNGDLVRNTDNDSDVMAFMKQGLRITKALAAARDVLEKANHE